MFSALVGAVSGVLVAWLYLTFAPTSPLASPHIGGLMERLVIFDRDVWYAVLG